MSAERFTLDTNILVYAVDRNAGTKHDVAAAVVDRSAERNCVLTIQALGEFFAVVTRKNVVRHADATDFVRGWSALFPMAPSSGVALHAACRHVSAGGLAFWDAMLLATAGEAGCSIVLSEDMQDGAKFGGVTVRNPFAGTSLPDDLRQLLGLE